MLNAQSGWERPSITLSLLMNRGLFSEHTISHLGWLPKSLLLDSVLTVLIQSSSIVLQKLRIVTLTTYMTETADRLAEVAEYPTDQYLPYIIRLQRVAEDIDDIVKNESTLDPMQIQAAVSDARERIELFKNNLSFPLGDCRK